MGSRTLLCTDSFAFQEMAESVRRDASLFSLFTRRDLQTGTYACLCEQRDCAFLSLESCSLCCVWPVFVGLCFCPWKGALMAEC